MTYPELAAHYKVTLEELGWEDRRVTRSGLRRFLIAVYEHQMAKRGIKAEEWERLWLANTWAYAEGHARWHRQIPRLCFDFDRARVAELLGPRRTWGTDKSNPRRIKASRWASNRSL